LAADRAPGNRCDYSSARADPYRRDGAGTDCGYELIGVDCGYELIGTDCGYELIGTDCGYELIGTDCGCELIGTDCGCELIGTDCGYELIRVVVVSTIALVAASVIILAWLTVG